MGGRIRVLDFCEETNPFYYLENEAERPKNDYVSYLHNTQIELERENEYESSEIHENNENVKRDDNISELSYLPYGSNEGDFDDMDMNNRYVNHEIQDINRRIDSLDKDTDNKEMVENMERIMQLFTGLDEATDLNSNYNDEKNQNTNKNISNASESLKHDIEEVLHPHDESERSDTDIPANSFGEVVYGRNKVTSGSRRRPDENPVKSYAHSPSHITQPPPGFKPQFEGGFVPLVLNTVKEKESVLMKDFVLPPPSI